MAIWATWDLCNLDFEQLGLWGIWTLDSLGTCTLDHLGNLDFWQFPNSSYWETYVLKNLTRALMAESISGLLLTKSFRRNKF